MSTPREESESGPSTIPEKLAPPLRYLFVLWLKVAAQGVGGGGASQLSAYNSMVRSRKFFSARDWGECWAVCQVVPGVNIIAMSLLTGSRLAGLLGAAVSLAGLVVPSAALALVIASVYAQFAGSSLLHASLHGVIAAGAAASFMNSYRLSRPALSASYVEGAISVVVAIVTAAAAAFLIERTQLPVFILLLSGGAAMAITVSLLSRFARKVTA